MTTMTDEQLREWQASLAVAHPTPLLTTEQLTELTRRHGAASEEVNALRGKRGPVQQDFEFKALEYVYRLLNDVTILRRNGAPQTIGALIEEVLDVRELNLVLSQADRKSTNNARIRNATLDETVKALDSLVEHTGTVLLVRSDVVAAILALKTPGEREDG